MFPSTPAGFLEQTPAKVVSDTGRPILSLNKNRVTPPQSAQSTAFLRRRKVVKILAQKAEVPEKPGQISNLTKFKDYPVERVMSDLKAREVRFQNSTFMSRELEGNFSDEFWIAHGAVNGRVMDRQLSAEFNSIGGVEGY